MKCNTRGSMVRPLQANTGLNSGEAFIHPRHMKAGNRTLLGLEKMQGLQKMESYLTPSISDQLTY